MAGEDSASYTIKPRLRGLRYKNNQKFHILDGVKRGDGIDHFDLGKDCRHLATAIEDIGDVSLVVIDTLDCFVAGKDTNSSADARAITTPLSALAERYNVAIIAIRHLNKKTNERAMHRACGSISWIGAARAAYLVACDNDDKDLRYWAAVKLNIARMPSTMTFSIDSGYTLKWGTTIDLSADDILTPPKHPREEKAKKTCDAVREWLCTLLADGPVLSEDVHREAIVKGFTDSTLKRSKMNAGVLARQYKLDGDQRKMWYWHHSGWSEPEVATEGSN